MKNSPTFQFIPGQSIAPRKKSFAIILLSISLIVMLSCSKTRQDLIDPASNEAMTDETVGITAGATYYLAPTGNDANNGSISAPFKTLNKAWTVVTAGDLIYLRGGEYKYASEQSLMGKSGTATSQIKVWAYPGEIPVITQSAPFTEGALIYFEGAYVHFKGLELMNFRSPTGRYAFHSEASNNCTYELMNIHHNRSAMGIRGNSNANLVLNSDFHHNADPEEGYGGADGLNISIIPNVNSTNTIRGCRAWYNSDDGFDTWDNNGYVLLENCWSWHNGFIEGGFQPAGDGSGFKLGQIGSYSTVKRTLRNCVAANNLNWGFNENKALCKIELFNNTAIGNGKWNYVFGWFGASSTVAKNNISYTSGNYNNKQDEFVYTTATNNSWNGKTVTNTDFQSLVTSQLLLARKADGSLPDISYLKLASGSDLIDAGINIGLPFIGSLPDIGAFESGVTILPPLPGNQPPIANAGTDKNITLPANSTSLTGSGTDPDGLIVTYAWTRISGPNTPGLSGSTTATLSLSNLVAGTYVYRLTASDILGSTAFDEANIVVSSGGSPVPPTSTINVSQAIQDAGFSYYLVQDFGTLPDITTNTTRSTLRIFENGVELNPAHSNHDDIANLGRGRFSHWGDGAFIALYFSSSDNTNPRTNGRTYTYSLATTPPAPTPAPTNTPYGGTARTIPGTIQAEDFDNGGQNIGYYDKSSGNAGGAYRTAESVDVSMATIESSHIVGSTQSGEWLKYTVNVTSAGNYKIQARVASASGGKSIRIEMDGITVATVAITNTGGSSTWKTITVSNIPLTTGTKVMRILNVTSGQNINHLQFVKQ